MSPLQGGFYGIKVGRCFVRDRLLLPALGTALLQSNRGGPRWQCEKPWPRQKEAVPHVARWSRASLNEKYWRAGEPQRFGCSS